MLHTWWIGMLVGPSNVSVADWRRLCLAAIRNTSRDQKSLKGSTGNCDLRYSKLYSRGKPIDIKSYLHKREHDEDDIYTFGSSHKITGWVYESSRRCAQSPFPMGTLVEIKRTADRFETFRCSCFDVWMEDVCKSSKWNVDDAWTKSTFWILLPYTSYRKYDVTKKRNWNFRTSSRCDVREACFPMSSGLMTPGSTRLTWMNLWRIKMPGSSSLIFLIY